MRFLKPLGSLVMALLIGITSLGVAVSAHRCSESGYTETSLKPIKPCCKQAEGHGFRAEPCCKLSVHHVKLATVRMADASVQVPMAMQWIALPALIEHFRLFEPSGIVQRIHPSPPESPPLASGRAIQTQFCRYLI